MMLLFLLLGEKSWQLLNNLSTLIIAYLASLFPVMIGVVMAAIKNPADDIAAYIILVTVIVLALLYVVLLTGVLFEMIFRCLGNTMY